MNYPDIDLIFDNAIGFTFASINEGLGDAILVFPTYEKALEAFNIFQPFENSNGLLLVFTLNKVQNLKIEVPSKDAIFHFNSLPLNPLNFYHYSKISVHLFFGWTDENGWPMYDPTQEPFLAGIIFGE